MSVSSVFAAFTGRIVSDETGEALAVSIVVMDKDGKVVEIEGDHAHVEYLGKNWCYVDGSFELNALNTDGLSVSIRRGLETLPLDNIPLKGENQTFR
ncbi:MAG: hypothetical protein KJT03_13190, partial [Verrucomicrobiae bacterium]|nr:hypothetical protein [Verrucomicrobiae bacterium]